jgi:FkbM family methyltransferase
MNLGTDLAVLAFADELGAEPALLSAWGTAFTGADDISLIIHPGECSEPEVGRLITSAAEAAGLDVEAHSSASLVALTGPLGQSDDALLASQCVAVLTHRNLDAPFDHLRRLDDVSVAALRSLLAPDRWQIKTVKNHWTKWTVLHRGSREDLVVIDDVLVQSCYWLGRFQFQGFPELADLGRTSAAGLRPLIVDCGANIGAASMYFSQAFPDARIVSVEPASDNFDLLWRNVDPLRVRSVQAAVASRPGSLAVRDPGAGAWAYRTGAEEAAGTVIGEVDAITIEQILEDEPGTTPFILKVDIEGAESDLFSANTEAISRFPVVIIELHDWMLPGEGTSQSFLRWHLDQEREFVHHGENVFSLSPRAAAR